jgi:hypothetical protein
MRRSKVVAAQKRTNAIPLSKPGKADLAGRRGNVERLERTRSSKRSLAPFDGTVTQRHIEVRPARHRRSQ